MPTYTSHPATPGDAADVMQAIRARRQAHGLNIAYFGHSLLQRHDVPAIDIPATLAAIHAQARQAGRSDVPLGVQRAHYEGPQNLGYWFQGAGQAREKLATDDPGWDLVVGVGFMHMVRGSMRDSFLYNTVRRFHAGPTDMKFMTYAAYTPHKYRAMRVVRAQAPGALWVNYVGPRTSDAPGEQPLVDARFECIRQSAFRAGVPSLNVPVGRAFRDAERRAAARPELGLQLQVDDRLHLTRAGEYLAANVFYAMLYEVDPVGLPLPGSHRGQIVASQAHEAEASELLQRAARDVVQAYVGGSRADCREQDLLAEDRAGEQLLSARP